MGPITGFRVVNLRVHDGTHDKVAYPDLTVDIGTGDHVVIGLENGGGKGTLLGFLLHLFLPDARLFLPRLAQRHQRREGEEKRIEHYVPGGRFPTHVVVELELPARDIRRPGQPTRVLAGTCLYKTHAGVPTEPAEQFFWSARCMTSQLTLAHLGLRSDTGRLLDHREWRSWLDTMRSRHPDAEIALEDKDRNWDAHLRNNLKVDVEFVKSWLLAMNKDEGAADHVFTYGSSRAFLETLISAVTPPEVTADINENLTAMAADADSMEVDRRREALLRDLVGYTGPLAEHMDELRGYDTTRRGLVDAILITQNQIQRRRTVKTAELEHARERETETENAASDANAAYAKTASIELLSRLQLAQLHQADAAARVDSHKTALLESEEQAKIRTAAALVSQEHAHRTRISDVERMLNANAQHAEPDRLAASSAAQAWLARLDTEIETLTSQHQGAEGDITKAQAEEDAFGQELLGTERDIAKTETSIENTRRELGQISELLKASRERGDLNEAQTVPEALAAAREQAAVLEAKANQAADRRKECQRQLDGLAEESSRFEARAARAESSLRLAQADLDQITKASSDLCAALQESRLLELDPIHLDDHAATISEALKAVAGSAGRRQLDVQVKAAAAQREVRSLEATGLLPPRPDVATLCELAARYGARPGWAYLAELPTDTAQRFAHALPELADGIIVNIPDDYTHVVDLVRQRRGDLQGPVTIGSPSDFETTSTSGAVTVVLPDEAFWSREAGHEQTGRRREIHDQHEGAVTEQLTRYEQALRLRGWVDRWQSEVGVGAETAAMQRRDEAQQAVSELPDARAELRRRQKELTGERDIAEKEERPLRQQAGGARSRAERLAALEKQTAPRERLDGELTSLDTSLELHKEAAELIKSAMSKARGDRNAASGRAARLAQALSELRSGHADAEALAAIVVRDGDPIRPEDAQAARDVLTERAKALVSRWQGLITDQELQAQLELLRQELNATLSRQAQCEPPTVEQANAAVTADPSRASADWLRHAEEANQASKRLSRELGGLEEAQSQRHRDTQRLESEVRQLRRASQLPAEYAAIDLAAAEEISRRLSQERDRASEERQRTGEEHEKAKKQAGAISDWIELASGVADKLGGIAAPLALAGPLTQRIDTEDRSFELSGVPLPEAAPHLLADVLELFDHADMPAAIAKEGAHRCTAEFNGEVSRLQALLDETSRRAQADLDGAEATLRGAGDELIAGDKLIHVLRDMHRGDLAANAADHHHSASARLTAVAHHVAQFKNRLERLAQTTFASVQHLLRAVRQTVEASRLPSTPAMGRWGGLPLLKISGLDGLTTAQRQAAILTALQTWFDPGRATRRPRFDADSAVTALVEAVTPRLTASVLIPSDPLDAEHKPVENLAVTSGGEGVTVALILASLLAARRARGLGHQRTTLLLDNPFAKVNKPMFLRLARDVAQSLGVQLVPLTGIRDLGALTVFPSLIQLRVSRRETANAVVPAGFNDERVQQLIRDGTLYVSPVEWAAAGAEANGDPSSWPVMSHAEVHWQQPLDLGLPSEHAPATTGNRAP